MQKEVRILSLVSYKFLPPQMGGQRCIAFFNRYLSRLVNLICITVKDNGPAIAEGYPVKNLLSKSPGRYANLAYFFTLRRIIRSEKITHLILEHPYYGWLGILLKWGCKIKLIVHSHNIESQRFKSLNKWWWGILWHYEKFVHKKANHSFFIQSADRNYAIEKYELLPENCTIITYGVEQDLAPSITQKKHAKQYLCKTHGFEENETILLFNGSLGYAPNMDAVEVILKKINPLLMTAPDFSYKIIICGSKLPAQYNSLADYKESNIIYAGFVDDISVYFRGADIFINPVIEGGGIKTKIVEALGHNLSVISTQSGSIGIPSEVTGCKMLITEDYDWVEFSNAIKTIDTSENTLAAFFDYFYWGNIAAKASSAITEGIMFN